MNKPRILRIIRPYKSIKEYIESEGWTISSKRMILLDQPRLDRDTIVRFELSLQSGEKLIRAEARVVGYQAATPDRSGGPKVRFKRFGGSTKAFIQQVMAEHGPGPGLDTLHPTGDSAAPSVAPMSMRFSDPASAPDPTGAGSQPLEFQTLSLSQQGAISVRNIDMSGVGPGDLALLSAARERLTGLMARGGTGPVSAPRDRDAVLGRLRDRARSLSEASTSVTGPNEAGLHDGASQAG